MPVAYVGLGSNLGDRLWALNQAVQRLERLEHTRVLAVSKPRETRAAGGPAGQPTYLNAAAALETRLSPEKLLAQLRQVENELGRERRRRWGPRQIDLDLLMYNEQVLDGAELALPHPRMHFRRFVLEPLAEIAPEAVHATTGRTVAELLVNLNRLPHYLALAGDDSELAALATRVGGEVATRRGARFIGVGAMGNEKAARRPERARGMRGQGGGSRQTESPSLESIRKVVGTLAAERSVAGSTGTKPWLISDFWLDDLYRVARGALNPGECAAFEESWKQFCEDVVEPTILVRLLRAGEEPGGSVPQGHAGVGVARVAGVEREVRTARRPVQTAVVADPGSVTAEVEAIMDAVEG